MKNILITVAYLSTLTACTSPANIEANDEHVFIAGDAIKELPCNGGESQKYAKKNYVKEGIDSYSIFYYFDSTKNKELECPIKATTRVRVSLNRQTANDDYDKTISSAHIGIKLTDEVKTAEGFYSYGDRSSFSYILSDGEKVGFYFIAQKGNVTYAVNMRPIKLDSGQRFGEIFEKRFENIFLNTEKYKAPIK